MKKWICKHCGGSKFKQKIVTEEYIWIDRECEDEDQSGWVTDNKIYHDTRDGGEVICGDCNKKAWSLSGLADFKEA